MQKLQWLLARLTDRVGVSGLFAWLLLISILLYGFYVFLPAQQRLTELEKQPVQSQRMQKIEYLYESPADRFLAKMPSVEKVASHIQTVFDVAKNNRLDIKEVVYKDEQRTGETIVHYSMNFSVEASYPVIKAFIVEALAALPFLALEQLVFERGNVDSDVVTADLKFTLYLVR